VELTSAQPGDHQTPCNGQPWQVNGAQVQQLDGKRFLKYDASSFGERSVPKYVVFLAVMYKSKTNSMVKIRTTAKTEHKL
jgi:hypothetical protein